jgi:hypothetical protein
MSKISMSDLYMGKKALLVGNGVNLLSEKLTWKNLLYKLRKEFDVNVRISNDKAYPLIFEELLFCIRGESIEGDLKALQVQISEIMQDYNPNDYHREIFDLKNTNILTTNYDYAFERVEEKDYQGPATPGKGGEYRYSRKRRNTINGKNIWHIHGELNSGYKGLGTTQYPEQSILIGNEHYADYLSLLHENLKPFGGNKGLARALNDNPDIWSRFFFTHDIDIVGFNMDYAEIHLWWLINFRARLKRTGSSIRNIIRFNYPSFEKKEIENKLSVLLALEIELNEVPVNRTSDITNDYHRFYDKFLESYDKF